MMISQKPIVFLHRFASFLHLLLLFSCPLPPLPYLVLPSS